MQYHLSRIYLTDTIALTIVSILNLRVEFVFCCNFYLHQASIGISYAFPYFMNLCGARILKIYFCFLRIYRCALYATSIKKMHQVSMYFFTVRGLCL